MIWLLPFLCTSTLNGAPRGKHDGVILHILEREKKNWMGKIALLREWSIWHLAWLGKLGVNMNFRQFLGVICAINLRESGISSSPWGTGWATEDVEMPETCFYALIIAYALKRILRCLSLRNALYCNARVHFRNVGKLITNCFTVINFHSRLFFIQKFKHK